MAKLEFRDLRADEIDCRIATVKENGITLLLYKDARCDMNILDETVGAMNWQRTHSRDNANCTVSIWDGEKEQWISKEDTGTESNTEAEKGLASDSFKRACFNWGIGRELYTAPFIWVDKKDIKGKYDKFIVQDITIKNKKITGLTIYNKDTKKVVFTLGKNQPRVTQTKEEPVATSRPEETAEEMPHRIELRNFIKDNNLTKEQVDQIKKECGLNNQSKDSDYEMALIYAITATMV